MTRAPTALQVIARFRTRFRMKGMRLRPMPGLRVKRWNWLRRFKATLRGGTTMKATTKTDTGSFLRGGNPWGKGGRPTTRPAAFRMSGLRIGPARTLKPKTK